MPADYPQTERGHLEFRAFFCAENPRSSKPVILICESSIVGYFPVDGPYDSYYSTNRIMASTSTLEMAILGLLGQKPQSGYDLRKTFATTAMRHYSDSPGSIYPALRRLESRGWIAGANQDGGEDSRKRQEFALTEAGKGALIAWLDKDVSREDVTFRIAEMMLRFAFMDGNVSRSTTIRFLDQFSRELGIYVGELRAKFEQTGARVPLHTGLLAFELGIRGMETQLAWAQEARARLTEALR